MAKITLDGREFDIARYKLGALRQVAPIVDRINAAMTEVKTMEGLTRSATDLAAVLSVGLVKIDPDLTPEGLDDIVGFEDLPNMLACFTELMTESGLEKGEVSAPAPDKAPAGASSKA